MDGQVLTWAGVTTVLGIILPPFMAFIKRVGWEKRTQDLVILAVLIIIGGGAGFLVGDIDPFACSRQELAGCLAVVMAYIGSTVTQALVWYKMYWEGSAVETKLAGK